MFYDIIYTQWDDYKWSNNIKINTENKSPPRSSICHSWDTHIPELIRSDCILYTVNRILYTVQWYTTPCIAPYMATRDERLRNKTSYNRRTHTTQTHPHYTYTSTLHSRVFTYDHVCSRIFTCIHTCSRAFTRIHVYSQVFAFLFFYSSY